MPVVVETVGFEAMDRRLAAVPAVSARELRRELARSLFDIERDAKGNVPRDRATLQRSIHSSITGTGGSLTGLVGPSVAYGAPVEFGRKAGTSPPLEPLIGWVQRRGLGQTFSVRTQRRQTGAAARGRTVAIARAIQRKIFRRGIAPHPFLVPAFEQNLPAIRARFAAIGVRLVAGLAR